MKLFLASALLLLVSALLGCQVTPDYEKAEVPSASANTKPNLAINDRLQAGVTGPVTDRTTKSQLAESETAVASNLVAVYKALGGGWQVRRSPQ